MCGHGQVAAFFNQHVFTVWVTSYHVERMRAKFVCCEDPVVFGMYSTHGIYMLNASVSLVLLCVPRSGSGQVRAAGPMHGLH